MDIGAVDWAVAGCVSYPVTASSCPDLGTVGKLFDPWLRTGPFWFGNPRRWGYASDRKPIGPATRRHGSPLTITPRRFLLSPPGLFCLGPAAA